MQPDGEDQTNGESKVYPHVLSNTKLLADIPSRGRSNSDVVRRMIDDNIPEAVLSFNYNPESNQKLITLSRDLWKTPFTTEGDFCGRTRDVLRYLTPKCKVKYDELMFLVQPWRSNRVALVEKLNSYADRLDKSFKWSTVVRFVASSADVTGSVGGLMCSTESNIANYSFNFASFCGLCGLFSTVAEVENSKRILDDVTKSMEEDQNLLKPVVKWLEESKELDTVVQELFPHGIDSDIVDKIKEDRAEQQDYLNVFRAALLTNVKKDGRLLKNTDFLHSLKLFAESEVAPLWWSRILYRKHPVILDLSRMSLQMEFGQMQSIVFQCIPALPLEQQRLNSLPVAGRLMLNLLTMFDSFTDLRNGSKSSHSDKLRKLLQKLNKELEHVDQTVEEMKPQSSEAGSDTEDRDT